VQFEADLAEELLKSAGYNSTPATLPRVEMGALPSHPEEPLPSLTKRESFLRSPP